MPAFLGVFRNDTTNTAMKYQGMYFVMANLRYCAKITRLVVQEHIILYLVGGLNPSDKYESEWEG